MNLIIKATPHKDRLRALRHICVLSKAKQPYTAPQSLCGVAFIFLGAICAILVLFAKPIAGIYISQQGELFDMVVFSSVMIGIYAPLNGLVRSRISYLNAVKKTRNMQIMTFLSSVVYTIISAFVLGKLFGAYGVLASDLMRAVLLMLTVWIIFISVGFSLNKSCFIVLWVHIDLQKKLFFLHPFAYLGSIYYRVHKYM